MILRTFVACASFRFWSLYEFLLLFPLFLVFFFFFFFFLRISLAQLCVHQIVPMHCIHTYMYVCMGIKREYIQGSDIAKAKLALLASLSDDERNEMQELVLSLSLSLSRFTACPTTLRPHLKLSSFLSLYLCLSLYPVLFLDRLFAFMHPTSSWGTSSLSWVCV